MMVTMGTTMISEMMMFESRRLNLNFGITASKGVLALFAISRIADDDCDGDGQGDDVRDDAVRIHTS